MDASLAVATVDIRCCRRRVVFSDRRSGLPLRIEGNDILQGRTPGPGATNGGKMGFSTSEMAPFDRGVPRCNKAFLARDQLLSLYKFHPIVLPRWALHGYLRVRPMPVTLC